MAWLVHMESRTDTRIVGRAELQINYSNFGPSDASDEARSGATDPATIASVALFIAVVATAACLIPANRAARVDPMVVLRDE